MAYTGTWRRKQLGANGTPLTVHQAPLGHPELATLHMQGTPDTTGSRPPWAAVPGVTVPVSVLDPGSPYDLTAGSRRNGLVFDTEPTDNHQDGTSTGGGQSLAAARAQGNAARSIDRGAPQRETFRAKRIRAVDEVRETRRLEVEPISGGSRIGALRGDNGLPENNPEGFRNGMRVQRFMNRRIPGTARRDHNPWPARVRVAAAPHVSPAPATYNRYTSPFSQNQRARARFAQMPLARRTPRPWDDNVTTDGTPIEAPVFQTWGL